jgi:hypothetical protein
VDIEVEEYYEFSSEEDPDDDKGSDKDGSQHSN